MEKTSSTERADDTFITENTRWLLHGNALRSIFQDILLTDMKTQNIEFRNCRLEFEAIYCPKWRSHEDWSF